MNPVIDLAELNILRLRAAVLSGIPLLIYTMGRYPDVHVICDMKI